ncbi:MAG TPA: hypothetical protein VGE04_13175 [Chloroflexia bacterium]|jgi:hypothetical protein
MSANLPQLDIQHLKVEARNFVHTLNNQPFPNLYGVTDGKAVGTEVELIFRRYLLQRYMFEPGNAAIGIDYPELNVDLKLHQLSSHNHQVLSEMQVKRYTSWDIIFLFWFMRRPMTLSVRSHTSIFTTLSSSHKSGQVIIKQPTASKGSWNATAIRTT